MSDRTTREGGTMRDVEAARAQTDAGPSPDAELDCRGLLCPLPVYQASRAIDRLQPGQALRVECTDPGSLADFPALARQRGLTLLSAEERDGIQVFRLRKEVAR
jgi:tRNA 2-thiouridine synthesizing protein A